MDGAFPAAIKPAGWLSISRLKKRRPLAAKPGFPGGTYRRGEEPQSHGSNNQVHDRRRHNLSILDPHRPYFLDQSEYILVGSAGEGVIGYNIEAV